MTTAALWWVLAAAAAEPDCRVDSPAVLAERLRTILATGDNLQAVALVHEAEPKFPCYRSFVSADELASVYQLAATAAFYSPALAEAPGLFRRAAVVGPNVPFDAHNLGPEAAAAYHVEHAAVATGPSGALLALGPVVVDGTTARPGTVLVVPVGVHLVQEAGEDGVRTRVIEVATGETTRIGTPDPALVSARTTLRKRQRAAYLGGAVGLLATSGGLFAVAATQKADFLSLDPEGLDDPERRARETELLVNASFVGAVLAAGGGVGLGWRGLTLRLDLDPTVGTVGVSVGGPIGAP